MFAYELYEIQIQEAGQAGSFVHDVILKCYNVNDIIQTTCVARIQFQVFVFDVFGF